MNMMSKKKIVDIAYELKRAFEEKNLKAIENIYPIRGGFIQQCVFRGFYKSTGKEMETHAMIRVYCRKDKVFRIEDYSDPRQGSVPDLN